LIWNIRAWAVPRQNAARASSSGGMSVSKKSPAKRSAAILSKLSSRICASRSAGCASLPESPSSQY
jgi:hypothetical protein